MYPIDFCHTDPEQSTTQQRQQQQQQQEPQAAGGQWQSEGPVELPPPPQPNLLEIAK